MGRIVTSEATAFSVYPLTYMISCNNYYILPYRKIPKISPGAYIFQRPFLRGLSTEGNLCFKIDWASVIVGSKFTVFALFYFEFERNFPSTSPQEAYIWRGDLTKGFLHYQFGGLILFILWLYRHKGNTTLRHLLYLISIHYFCNLLPRYCTLLFIQNISPFLIG